MGDILQFTGSHTGKQTDPEAGHGCIFGKDNIVSIYPLHAGTKISDERRRSSVMRSVSNFLWYVRFELSFQDEHDGRPDLDLLVEKRTGEKLERLLDQHFDRLEARQFKDQTLRWVQQYNTHQEGNDDGPSAA